MYRWGCSCFIFFTNVLFFAVGWMMLIVACIMLFSNNVKLLVLSENWFRPYANNATETELGRTPEHIAWGMLILGLFLLFMSIMGLFSLCCCGPGFACVHVILAMCLLYGSIIFMIIFFATPNVMKTALCDWWRKNYFKLYIGETKQNIETKSVDQLQRIWHCCGVFKGEDFLHISWDRWTNTTFENEPEELEVPLSCCKPNFLSECVHKPRSNFSYFHSGCCNAFWEGFLHNALRKMSFLCIAIALLLSALIQITVYYFLDHGVLSV